MPNKFLFFVCHLIGMVATSAQGNFEIEWSESIQFLDNFGESAKRFNTNGYALQSDLTTWYTIEHKQKFVLRFGVGYSNYWYLNVGASPRLNASYVSGKFGLDYPIIRNKLSGMLELSNYFFVQNQSTANFSLSLIEPRVYSNVALGLRIRTGKRTEISVSSPFSILPIVRSKKGYTHNDDITGTKEPFKVWMDMWGASLGIKWTLGKVEDRAKRSKEKVRIDRY